jgi:hypothetical protein
MRSKTRHQRQIELQQPWRSLERFFAIEILARKTTFQSICGLMDSEAKRLIVAFSTATRVARRLKIY